MDTYTGDMLDITYFDMLSSVKFTDLIKNKNNKKRRYLVY